MAASGRARATTIRITIRSDARELRDLRRRVSAVLEGHRIDPRLSEDLLLVLNELTTNAIEASALGSDIGVELTVERTQITIAVENVGPPFTLQGDATAPPPTSPRGRGLVLTRQIVSDLTTEPIIDGTRVMAVCRRS